MNTIRTLEDFISLMPKGLKGNIQKARFLYLELGKRSFYDTEYSECMFGEEEEYTKYTYKSYTDPNIIICTTLSKQFAKLLEMARIPCEMHKDNFEHYFITFFDESGNSHITDITNDLKNIQFGCRTHYFGKETISEDVLEQIDLELKYISRAKSYTDDYWNILQERIEQSKLSLKEKLEIILGSLEKYGDIFKPRNY